MFYLCLCFLSIMLFNPFYAQATEPTLARLSFFVKPDSLKAFEGVYHKNVLPIMSSYGLEEKKISSRFESEGVFSRVYEVENPAHVQTILKDLNKNKMWQDLLLEWGKTFGAQSLQPGKIPFNFQIFMSPAGEGKPLPQHIGVQKPMGQGTAHWKTYDETNGLISDAIAAILQDDSGYLWFCTSNSGIVRFDGKTWKTIDTKDGLSNNRIRTAIKDAKGNLWFGTASGISCFNPTADQDAWKIYRDILPNHYVWSSYLDRDNNLWFGLNGAVACFDGQNWRFITIEDGLAQDRYMAICQDREGNLWFGSQRHGVYRYKDHTLKNITKGLPDVFVSIILQDQKGDLWFGTHDGICRYDGEHFTTFTTEHGLSSNRIISVGQHLLDNNGHIWFGTDNGVSRYDGRNWYAITPENGFPLQEVRSIFQDREGQIWFGGAIVGAVCYSEALTTFSEKDGLVGDHPRVIFSDQNGTLWFGDHNNGVAQWDGETLTQYTKQNGFPDNVTSIYQGRNKILWLGTNDAGVLKYGDQTFRQFTKENGLLSNFTYDLVEDRNGYLYFLLEGGLSQYDGQNFTTISRTDGFPYSWPYKSIVDHKGHLWFGSYHGGATHFDGHTFTTYNIQDGLASDIVTAIVEDRNNNIWFGTANGVSKFNGKIWQNFTTDDGLGGSWTEVVYQDSKDQIWIGTRGGGVTRFDGQVFQTLTTDDGLASNIVNDITEDQRGHIWFSTAKGATRYIQPQPMPPSITITGVVADQRYADLATLSIPNTTNLVTFEFDGVNLKTRPESMVYRYRLEGFDDEWRHTHKCQVEYENLPIGSYVFEVQSIDRDLIYSATVVQLALDVHPDYERIITFSSLGIAILFLFTQAVRITRQKQRLQNTNNRLREESLQRQHLDAQLQHFQYLDRLRTMLNQARSPKDIVEKTGLVLSEIDSISAHIVLDTQMYRFREIVQNNPTTYTHPIIWNNQTRGHLSIDTTAPLTESQQHVLLDETTIHMAHALQAYELEMQLLQSTRLASMGQLAAGVAHELNQPLSAISTTVGDLFQCYKEGILLPSERLQDMMQGLLNVVARMKTTIDHLRIFSRDTSQEPDIPVQINDSVHNCLTMIQAQLKNHNIDLTLDLADNLPTLIGHAHQLEQVIINLLANARDALDHVSNRKKRIVVRSRQNAQNVVLEIQDNGIGIDEEAHHHIFEPFFTTKDANKGTGLGLSISYAIVRNHNGTITCQSQKEQGTTFRVELPIP